MQHRGIKKNHQYTFEITVEKRISVYNSYSRTPHFLVRVIGDDRYLFFTTWGSEAELPSMKEKAKEYIAMYKKRQHDWR